MKKCWSELLHQLTISFALHHEQTIMHKKMCINFLKSMCDNVLFNECVNVFVWKCLRDCVCVCKCVFAKKLHLSVIRSTWYFDGSERGVRIKMKSEQKKTEIRERSNTTKREFWSSQEFQILNHFDDFLSICFHSIVAVCTLFRWNSITYTIWMVLPSCVSFLPYKI